MTDFPDWLSTVYHSGATPYVSSLYPRFADTISIKLRVSAESPVKQIWLRTFPDGEQRLTPMHLSTAGDTHWYSIDHEINAPRFHYRFLLEADDGVWWYTAKGPQLEEPLDCFDFSLLADYHAPSWLLESVFYQIFPDRFANGDPSTDPHADEPAYQGVRPKTFPWATPPDLDQPFPIMFYGGDLPGIEQHLDHIEALGVNAIYLNPIFTGQSYHKYDGADYDNVDPHFGGNSALISLREALTARGLRYMLDIVPNHCGYLHHWFQTAQADKNAPEADFFTFHEHPDQYESWLGVWTLPKLNYNNLELRNRMYLNQDSVMRKWLKPPFSADAWRVDVANMLGRQGATQISTEITRDMRNAIKQTSPDSYLLGENFFDATDQLQGDQYDGIMNYMGFTNPLIHWLTGYSVRGWGMRTPIRSTSAYSTAAMLATMSERMSVIPWQKALQQFNLLGSHDTDRIRSLVGGDDALHKLAVTILMTFPGIPCIYYGDEIGMLDHPDLAQRACMVWNEQLWNHDLLAFYQQLINLRRQSVALQKGSFQIVASAENHFAYTRDDHFLIIASRSDQAATTLSFKTSQLADGNWIDLLTGTSYQIANATLQLSHLPKGAMLLRPHEE